MTANKAAAQIRHQILRELDRIQKTGCKHQMDKLRTYIKGMAKRASKKPGGLGRK